DGYTGRHINTQGLTSAESALLARASIEGGESWKAGSPENSLVFLDLSSTRSPNNSQKQYNLFFRHYREPELASQFQLRMRNMSGGNRAEWRCEFDCLGWSNAQIDAKIVQIIKWHASEIARIKALKK